LTGKTTVDDAIRALDAAFAASFRKDG